MKTTLDQIASALDALATVSTDALCDFTSGTIPDSLDVESTRLLGELTYLPGSHPGVSDDAPEVLARHQELGLVVVGYDDHAGGHGLAVAYEAPTE